MVSTATHEKFLLKFDIALKLVREQNYSIRKACQEAKIDRKTFRKHFLKLSPNLTQYQIKKYKKGIKLGRKKYLSPNNMQILRIFSNSLDCCNFPPSESSFMDVIIQLKASQENISNDGVKPPSKPTLRKIISECKLKKRKVILIFTFLILFLYFFKLYV